MVGRYELLDQIGHGGMAVVYLARQTDLDRMVALKELRVFDSPDDPALAERFLREARLAGSMGHPNIVTVHEYFKHEGRPYIAMEYLRRGSLRPWVGRMSLAQIAGVLEGLLAALDHAQRNRVVHRDLKPENLLVTDQGQVKVADFGIAKARTMNTNAFLTAAGTTVGTPTYMAPEQAMAQELGPYTDLYSVGVMAYELLLGQVPFHDTQTPVAIILRHVNEQIASAHSVDPSVDPALSDWIDRLLIKDPGARTQTAEAAWEDLEEIVLRLAGSRWRRDARLAATAELPFAAPLTPAPFTSTGVERPAASDVSQSFAWNQGPRTEAPSVPEVVPEPEPELGPERLPEQEPEPEPIPEPRPEPVPEPESEPAPDPEPEFRTFGRTSLPPDPPAHEPSPPVEPAAEPAPPPQPDPPVAEPAFRTVAPRRPEPELPEWALPPPEDLPPPPSSSSPEPAAPAYAPRSVDAPTVMPDAVPEPPKPAPRPVPADIRRRRRVALAGAGALTVAVVAGAAVLAGGGSGDTDGPSTADPARAFKLENEDLALTMPASWTKSSTLPELPGLHAVNAVGAVRTAPPLVLGAELIDGNADPSLLSSRVRSALKGRIPKPQTVKLGTLEAYRYDKLALPDAAPMRVYAVLTTRGVATLACSTAATECDSIARTLTLKSARGLPVGVSEDYEEILNDTFKMLKADIRAVQIKARKAPRTVAAQASAQRQYARVYVAAIKALGGRARGQDLSPLDKGLRTKLAAVFMSFADGYALLGRAVSANDGAARDRAERLLKRAGTKVDVAVGALDDAGYTAPVPRSPTTAPPPPPDSTPPPAPPPPVAPPNLPPPPPPVNPPPPPSIIGGG